MSLIADQSGRAFRPTATRTDPLDRRRADSPAEQAFRKALESVPSGRARGSRSEGGAAQPGEDDAEAGSGLQTDPAAAPWLPVSLPAPRFAPLPATASSGGAADVCLPMPAAAIVAALDHAHGPVLPQAGDAAWHVTFHGDASLQAALHLAPGASSGWRIRVMVEGPLRQAALSHVEALRQRLQGRGRPVDECTLAEDE